jgi:ligand-binding sensor domain-containing protein
MNMLQFWISICFIVLVHLAEAQLQPTLDTFEPFFNNYAVEDGLPSNETYHVIQDRNGYIWSAGDQGVMRFDGENFDIFNADNGMTDDAVFKLYEDYHGRIWAVTSNMRLCYFEDDSIRAYQFNDSIAANCAHGTIPMSYGVDSSNTIYLSILGVGMLIIDASSNTECTTAVQTIYDESIKGWHRQSTWQYIESAGTLLGYHSATNYAEPREIKKTTDYLIRNSSAGLQDTMHSFTVEEMDHAAALLLHSVQYGQAISTDSMLIILFNGNWALVTRDNVQFFPEIGGITYIQHIAGKVWVALRNSGANCYDLKVLDAAPTSYLNEMTVTSVEKDWQGGHWFSALEHGLFYASNLNLASFSPPSFCSNVGALHLGRDPTYLAHDNGWVKSLLN